MWASGRYFDEATVARIQATVDAEPGMSRRALSRQLCEWLEWVGPRLERHVGVRKHALRP